MQGNAEQRQVPPLEIVERECGGADVFSALEDAVEHPPVKWTPKQIPKDEKPSEWVVSDKVAGIVDYLEWREGDFGKYRIVHLVRKDRSRVQVSGFGVTLAAWFKVLQVGDGVAISYLGTAPASITGYKDYDRYDCVVIRNGRRISRHEPVEVETEDEEAGDLPMASDV